ncbi:MAG TPA: DUF4838 domain-containing protein, partial [Victivallales bacterium]|nr:DUF4838 domain-containing protein [Victivallales bacterium]
MKKLLACLILSLLSVASFAGEQFIVKDGQANAQIVIAAEGRPRMATLAALELQRGIQKITGARLPIATSIDKSIPVKIYVGRSPDTDKLGLKTDDLKYGAFRIASGSNWLALLGDDKDFVPNKLTPLKRGDPKPVEEWKKLTADKTKGAWQFPDLGTYKLFWNPKDFSKVIDEYYGEGSAALWTSGGNSIKGFWLCDSAASINAVTDFLYGLGVRFYMPNKLGDVIPQLASIPLMELNRTVIPDYPCRRWVWYNYAQFPLEEVLWGFRLGMNDGAGYYTGVHGLTDVHESSETKKAHPEFYALIGGQRDTEHKGKGTPCFSSEGLFQETVNYCRFMFDELDRQAVDIWPVDGLKPCQCELCKDKTSKELVWNFVNRVATETY